jgi:hypothetical protein
MATYEKVTYNSPDGAQVGASSTELIAFHGSTPVDQYATVATLTLTTVLSSGFGFQTSAGAVAAIAAINSVIDCLKEKGIIGT